MQIAYFVVWNEAPGGTTFRGVFVKIQDQIRMWQQLGCTVKLFVHTKASGTVAEAFQDFKECAVHLSTYDSLVDRWREGDRLFHAIAAWQPDVVYCRHAFFLPVLRRLARALPLVVEVNTSDSTELLAEQGYSAKYWYYQLTRDWWLKHVAGFVFVSHEISEQPQNAKYGKPSIVIGNSIDLSRYPVLPAPQNPAPLLVFMAAAAPVWHGVDKILKLALHYPAWRFHLIGPLPSDLPLPLPENVVAHGFLSPPEFRPIVEKADVALGTLAMYRRGMAEASTLKVREYLAFGIPTIIGHRETDFPQPVPFLLTLPNTPDNVEGHYAEIGDFVTRWQGKRVERAQIGNLDTGVKERQRVDFFRRIVAAR